MGVVVGGEDFLEVLEFRLYKAGTAHTPGSVRQAFDNACFDPWVVIGSEVKVPYLCMQLW